MIQTPQQVLKRQPWYRGLAYEQEIASEEWQNFSRSIRAEYKNTCSVCRRSDVPTEVHHYSYAPDKKLWDNPDAVLLCTPCHRAMHKELTEFRKNVFRNLTPRTLQLLNEALRVGLMNNDPLKLMHAMAEMAASPRSVELFSTAWVNRTTGRSDQVPEKPVQASREVIAKLAQEFKQAAGA